MYGFSPPSCFKLKCQQKRSSPIQLEKIISIVGLRRGKGELRSLLIRGAAGSFALRVCATGLAFISSILLARFLGASQFGIYYLALTWLGLLELPAVFGFDKLLVREVAVYNERSEWGLLRGLLIRSNQAALLFSVVIALLALLIVKTTLSTEDLMMAVFIIAFVALPLRAITILRQATLQGFHRVITGQLPEYLIQPAVFITLLCGAYFISQDDLTALSAITVYLIAVFFALLVGVILLSRSVPGAIKKTRSEYMTKAWAISAIPMMIIGGLQVINLRIDIILLGIFKTPDEVGVYAVCARGAQLILFILTAANAILAPTIVSIYTKGDIKRLQRIITKSSRLIFLFSLPVALFLIFFGSWYLKIFGSGFAVGVFPLAILSVAQLFSVTAGSPGLILLMTGHERDVLWTGTATIAVNLLLNVFLIPPFGMNGAAVATSLGICVWPALSGIQLYRHSKINPTAICYLKKRLEFL